MGKGANAAVIAGLLVVALSSTRLGYMLVEPSWKTTSTAITTATPASVVTRDGRLAPDDDFMARHVAKASGGDGLWSVWDRKSVLHADAGSPCQWTEFKPSGTRIDTTGGGAGPAPSHMCLFPNAEDAYVGGAIRSHGRWPNCDVITRLLLRLGAARPSNATRPLTYVDIGANIGSCVMQVLLTTNATVVAFEPTPKNLFRLTSTLLNLPGHVKDRVTLFPVALGDRTDVSTVMTHPSNAGDTQVRRVPNETAADFQLHEKGVSHRIPVERVDDLLGPDLVVDLIKMDVQGFECYVVDGMTSLLGRTQEIMFEVEERLYKRFVGADACYGSRLVKALQRADFDIKSGRSEPIEDLTKKEGDELKSVHYGTQDMFGSKRRSREA